MGIKGGPTPQTPAQKKAKGVWGAAQLEKNMPKPETGRPDMPSDMSKEAKALWKSLMPRLEAQNTLAKIDGQQLARYCDLLAKYWRASKFVEEHGDTYECTTKSDTMVRPYPQVAHLIQYDAALRRTEARFGMTPADRLSIGIAIGEVQKAEKRAAREDGNILEVGI